MRERPPWALLERGRLELGEEELAGCVLRVRPDKNGLAVCRINEQTIIPWGADGTCSVELPEHDLVVGSAAIAWQDRRDVASSMVPGHRLLFVSALHWCNGVWHDGPVFHRLATGRIVSYLPAGGVGGLRIPMARPQQEDGLTWDEAQRVEGSDAARALRCIEGQLRYRLRGLNGADPLVLRIDDLTLAQAVTLAMLRRLFPTRELKVHIASSDLPPAWRRLFQNTDIQSIDRGAGIDIASLGDTFDPSLAPALAEEINAISDVLPRSLLGLKQ